MQIQPDTIVNADTEFDRCRYEAGFYLNVQFYTKFSVLKTLCAVLEREICEEVIDIY